MIGRHGASVAQVEAVDGTSSGRPWPRFAGQRAFLHVSRLHDASFASSRVFVSERASLERGLAKAAQESQQGQGVIEWPARREDMCMQCSSPQRFSGNGQVEMHT
jgi:hypothetical protein